MPIIVVLKSQVSVAKRSISTFLRGFGPENIEDHFYSVLWRI